MVVNSNENNSDSTPFVSLAETFVSLDKAGEMDFDVDFDALRNEQRKFAPENFDLSIFDDE